MVCLVGTCHEVEGGGGGEKRQSSSHVIESREGIVGMST